MPNDPFYKTDAWRQARMAVLNRDNWICTTCGRSVRARGQSNVDHIVSRRERPDLELSFSNLATLCASCHSHKTNRMNGGFGNRQSDEDRLLGECGADGEPLNANHPWNAES